MFMPAKSTVTGVRVMGLAVAILPNKRPALRTVVVDDAGGAPTVAECFDIPASDEPLAAQLHSLARAADSRARSAGQIHRVVVRRADVPPRASNAEGPKLRLLAEGAVIAAVRDVVPAVDVGTGKDIGRWHGSNKQGADGAASAVLAPAGRDSKYVDAAAAALAGLALGPP